MLPAFAEPTRVPVPVPAPLNFRPIQGHLRDVDVISFRSVENLSTKSSTAARSEGLRYEKTVHEYLQDRAQVAGSYLIEPEIVFCDDSGFRRCFPDGIFLLPSFTVIVEVKIQHMPEAWWQLRRLYEPLIAIKCPNVRVLEIVKRFDALMPFPETIELVDDLRDYLRAPPDRFCVHIWRP